MNPGISWLDGELAADPQISASNRGLLVGLGVFETLKVTHGNAEFLDRHLQRLRSGWIQIGSSQLDLGLVQSGVAEVLSANSHDGRPARLRITVTDSGDSPSVLVTLLPLQPWPETTTCIVLPWNRNESSPLVGIKSTSYAENVLGHRWAQERGYSEGLYLNNEGYLVEGSTTNVFLVMEGAVVTPAKSQGLLPGIIREVLLENGWAQEASLTLADLEKADEVFLTSSTRGIHPVLKCGAREFACVGSTTRRLMEAFQDLQK